MTETSTATRRPMTAEEWNAEGLRLFGADRMRWKFRCPTCGHVASVQDWKDAGAPEGAIGFSCVGRYSGAQREAFGEGAGPCNYAGGGLFAINPVHVTNGDDKYQMFEFADVES